MNYIICNNAETFYARRGAGGTKVPVAGKRVIVADFNDWTFFVYWSEREECYFFIEVSTGMQIPGGIDDDEEECVLLGVEALRKKGTAGFKQIVDKLNEAFLSGNYEIKGRDIIVGGAP